LAAPSVSSEERAGFLVRYRTRLGTGIALAALLAALFMQHPWPEISYLDFLATGLGVVLIAVGIAGRLWCTLYIGGRKGRVLQQDGPYSLSRHPLYLCSLLLALGLAVISENLLILILAVVYFAVQYRITIRHEEAVLAEAFGRAYKDYCGRVPCFFPRLSSYRHAPLPAISLSALRAECTHAVGFLVLAGLFELAETLHTHHLLPFISFP